MLTDFDITLKENKKEKKRIGSCKNENEKTDHPTDMNNIITTVEIL